MSASVHLARRLLQLERQNTSLRRELDGHRLQSEHASEEVNTHTHTNAQMWSPAWRHSLLHGILKSWSLSVACWHLQCTFAFPASLISLSGAARLRCSSQLRSFIPAASS